MDGSYEIRTVAEQDLAAVLELQQAIPGAFRETEPMAAYLTLCRDHLGETCFIALQGGAPVACLLCFVRGREGYCTTIAVRPGFDSSRAVAALLRRFSSAMVARVDTCWVSVGEESDAVRSLCKMLGTRGIGVRVAYGGPEENHIAARIARARLERLHNSSLPTQA